MSPGIFALDRYQISHVSRIEARDALWIETDPRQWAHAVEFIPRVQDGTEDKDALVVSVSLEVESGVIEVGALSNTGTTFLSESTVGPGSHIVDLPIAAIDRCRSITVRNAAATRSVVKIVGIAERRDDRLADSVDGIDLNAPIGSSRRGFWDKNIMADVRRLAGAGARTVLHVGAHHGDEASVYAKLFPRASIHCFEPSPAAFHLLQKKFGRAERMTLHQLALSDRQGVVRFYLNQRDEANSLYAFAPDAGRYVDVLVQGPCVEVPSSTIDDFVRESRLDSIDVLSLDVQGAELEVLRGALAMLQDRRINVVVAELIWIDLYVGQGAPHAILEFLARTGYRLHDFYNFAYAGSGQLLWGDAVFLPDTRTV